MPWSNLKEILQRPVLLGIGVVIISGLEQFNSKFELAEATFND